MKYIEVKDRLNNFFVFNLSDIKKVDPKFYRQRLNDWQEKGYIKKLRRGHYIFADIEITEEVMFLIANRLYSPSYVSLEMALNYYGLIPEGVYSVTSVSTKKTKSFETPVTSFSYRNVKPELFFGYRLSKVGERNYKIAEIEKAVLDYLYLNPAMSDENSFAEWRFDFETFQEKADMEKFHRYLSSYDSPGMNTRVKRFMKYME